MSTTSDLAPDRKPNPAGQRTSTRTKEDIIQEDIATASREERLEEQVAQLQADLKGIAATLAKLGGDKITEAREVAQSEVRHLRRQGQHMMDDVQEQAGEIEQQFKATIREKPITAVAAALGIGYILALISRR